jgi:2,3,4,5-tetrahydropyridine-2,6-dicarboxylate N-succinyltransferase
VTLQSTIQSLYAEGSGVDRTLARNAFAELRRMLGAAEVRAAEPAPASPTGWRVNEWVKQGILLGFRCGDLVDMTVGDVGAIGVLARQLPFYDKDTMPLKRPGVDGGIRIVPGGSSIRDGAYVAKGVICMPPMFINIGAYVDEGTMVDSHALVGSCAQIGKRVHLSAAAQIGGVLEPPGALPVIVEDNVFVGGNCGIYEGVLVRERAVLAPGVLLTGGTAVYDLVKGQVYRKTPDAPLIIPPGAVLVPGSRPASGEFAAKHQVSLYTPVIVKYRDDKTDAATMLEDALR